MARTYEHDEGAGVLTVRFGGDKSTPFKTGRVIPAGDYVFRLGGVRKIVGRPSPQGRPVWIAVDWEVVDGPEGQVGLTATHMLSMPSGSAARDQKSNIRGNWLALKDCGLAIELDDENNLEWQYTEDVGTLVRAAVTKVKGKRNDGKWFNNFDYTKYVGTADDGADDGEEAEEADTEEAADDTVDEVADDEDPTEALFEDDAGEDEEPEPPRKAKKNGVPDGKKRAVQRPQVHR